MLLQLPTGGGKTVLIAQMLAVAATRGFRAWFCVHRRELIDQAVQTFVEAADIHTGVIAAGYPSSPLAPVQVCSVPSLARRLGRVPLPDLLVWDECHHVASSTWAAIAQVCPEARQIGLTATPQRLDGKGLRPFFDALVAGPTTADLIARGHLTPYRLFAPGSVSLDGVRRVVGDFDKRQVGEAMDGSTVVGDAVQHYLEHCPNARALVFVWSLAASRKLADTFTMSGVAAAHVDGETPRGERTEAMRRFRAGELRVICNVDLFGEGLDVPAVDAIFLLRPTQSLGLYLQQVGRGLRPAPGKARVDIFDHVGNWTRHGLPDAPRVWSLDGREKKSRDEEAEPKRCLRCHAVSPAGSKVCVECGEPFQVKSRTMKHVDGALQAVDLDVLKQLGFADVPRVRPRTLADWQFLAREKGYKPGWAWHCWQQSGHR